MRIKSLAELIEADGLACEKAERISELKQEFADDLEAFGVSAFTSTLENDLWVSGPLSVIMEFCQANRSEIEELGN